jgi:hypothetical protein
VNKAAIPIFARLQALQTAAHVAPGGARVIAALSDGNPLAALLCEVNETVLGRTLTFESGDGSSLALEVSGRRVLRVVAANGLPEAEGCLAAEALEDEHKDNLIKLMQAVAAPRHELRVWAGPMTRDADGVSVGLPVALLADLLLVDLNPQALGTAAAPVSTPRPTTARVTVRTGGAQAASSPFTERPVTEVPRLSSRLGVTAQPRLQPAPDPVPDEAPEAAAPVDAPFLRSFAGDIGSDLMAWLIIGGQGDGMTDGPEEMVSHLQGFLDDEGPALNAQLDQVSTEVGTPVCLVLGASIVEGHSILCARKGPGILLGLIEGDATQSVLRAWVGALRA